MEQNQQPQPPVFNPQQPAQQPSQQFQPRVKAKPMMEPVTAVKTCLKKYFDFTGRGRRSEYWWFMLFSFILSSVFAFLGDFHQVFVYAGLLCSLLLFIPQLSALTRRMHDTSRSGWWVFFYCLTLIVAYGAFAVVCYPIYGELLGDGDNMMLVQLITDAFYNSPIAATVMMLSSLVFFLLCVLCLIFSILDSSWGENRYGPSPKYSN